MKGTSTTNLDTEKAEPLGDTGDSDTGVSEDEQVISNRSLDKAEDTDADEFEEDFDELDEFPVISSRTLRPETGCWELATRLPSFAPAAVFAGRALPSSSTIRLVELLHFVGRCVFRREAAVLDLNHSVLFAVP
jgi:hypothetical protein